MRTIGTHRSTRNSSVVVKAIGGPTRLETLRRLAPNPFPRFEPFLFDLTRRYGNVVAFALPWRNYVFVNDPPVVKDLFVTQQHAFSKSLGARALKYLLGEGLLTSEDPLHRQMRRIVQPAFHRERIAAYALAMQRHADDFVERIVPGRPFDVHAAMTELTLRIATTTLFGSDESGSSGVVSDALRMMMEEFPYILLPFGQLRRRLPLPSTRRFERARALLDRVIYDVIARRRRAPGDGTDALSLLLEAFDNDDVNLSEGRNGRSRRTSDEQIRDEVMTLFLAGHETTANLLTWTFYLLARNAGVEARLATAARDGDAAFVDRVVHETLRLYPPAWLIGRESLHDVTLIDGSFVPAGTTVFVSPRVLHVRPDLYRGPMQFDPDRWIGWEPAPFAFVPFGGGARRCIGEEFAWMEARIVLAAVARRYHFAMGEGVSVATLPSVTLRPAGPVPMTARLR
ncbi:MAG: cytochrome P450 [Candidatus Eremiobacteraeota bacterium]|nr:cytochrome P450 [Candidatus Eremiobacteraeota bacterium]MBV8284575.1 cytochrome P450 [Candidatus Eremiobacteraeota bacterium]